MIFDCFAGVLSCGLYSGLSLLLVSMKISPGEPVPPGFEDEVKPVSELQTTIDNCKNHALVALEYIVELTFDTDKEPTYHCVLCDKRGDPRTIMFHLTSYMHRLKFLVSPFPISLAA